MAHPIRTLTLGIAEPHPLSSKTITWAASLLHKAQTRFTNEGYDVQTVRISTRPLFESLQDWTRERIYSYTKSVQQQLDEVGIAFCSLGTVHAAHPDTPLEQIHTVADILATSTALNMTVQLATIEHGMREEAALPIAHTMRRLAHETEEGSGNFRFAMLACVPPGSPFFPSAYHEGTASLSMGLQGAGIVMDTIVHLREQQQETHPSIPLAHIGAALQRELYKQAEPLVTRGKTLANENKIRFGGIDLSPAPMGEDSIASALEQCGYGYIGEAGTLALAAVITNALKSVELPTCGYNGLMLPVLEDAVLGQRWAEGTLNAHQLLLYSAVCGTGLDTLPFPTDTPQEEVARLALDVATLALRLKKPLSARLFPVPDLSEGAYTTFRSPYLTNTKLRRLF